MKTIKQFNVSTLSRFLIGCIPNTIHENGIRATQPNPDAGAGSVSANTGYSAHHN